MAMPPKRSTNATLRLEHTPTERAPLVCASCNAKWPTPPAAPRISARIWLLGQPSECEQRLMRRYTGHRQAGCNDDIDARGQDHHLIPAHLHVTGVAAVLPAGKSVPPTTWSPTRTSFTASPIAITSPAKSTPQTRGPEGPDDALAIPKSSPCRIFQSTGFTPAAYCNTKLIERAACARGARPRPTASLRTGTKGLA